MKALFLGLVTLCICTPSIADTIQVTIGASLYLGAPAPNSPDPFDASIPSIPYPFTKSFSPTQGTLTFTYDSNLLPTDPTDSGYESTGPATLTFGDYSETASPIFLYPGVGEIDIFPELFALANGNYFVPIIDLNSSNPNTSFTLASLQTLTLQELSLTNSYMSISPQNPRSGDFLEGSIDSYSAVDLSAPEPSTWALFVGGLAFLGSAFRRLRRG